jgi:hypothetical protein
LIQHFGYIYTQQNKGCYVSSTHEKRSTTTSRNTLLGSVPFFWLIQSFYVSFSFSNCLSIHFYVYWMNKKQEPNGFNSIRWVWWIWQIQIHPNPWSMHNREKSVTLISKQTMKHNILFDLYCLNNQCKLGAHVGMFSIFNGCWSPHQLHVNVPPFWDLSDILCSCKLTFCHQKVPHPMGDMCNSWVWVDWSIV